MNNALNNARNLFVVLFLASLFLFPGCINPSPPQPLPNVSPTNSSEWSVYSGIGISFEFPSHMTLTQNLQSYNLGKGTASVAGESSGSALLLMVYTNSTIYGVSNVNGSDAAFAFLENDRFSDAAGMLNKATNTGEVSNYSLSSGAAFASEIPFSMEVLTSAGKSYFDGYAIDIFIPAKSALYRVRILAADKNDALKIKERFVQSFEG